MDQHVYATRLGAGTHHLPPCRVVHLVGHVWETVKLCITIQEFYWRKKTIWNYLILAQIREDWNGAFGRNKTHKWIYNKSSQNPIIKIWSQLWKAATIQWHDCANIWEFAQIFDQWMWNRKNFMYLTQFAKDFLVKQVFFYVISNAWFCATFWISAFWVRKQICF